MIRPRANAKRFKPVLEALEERLVPCADGGLDDLIGTHPALSTGFSRPDRKGE